MSDPNFGTAIVTAAGRGIGRGIALALADAGANLVVNSYTDETTAATAQAARERGAKVLALPGDITDAAVINACVEAAVMEFGSVDILVNNVGAGPKEYPAAQTGPLGPVAMIWDALYDQNLRAAVLMTEAVKPLMVDAKHGKIINISSIAGRSSLSDKMLEMFTHPSYGAMKAALVSYTQTMAEMLGPYNINVNAVCPGIIYTDAWASNAKKAVRGIDEFKGQDPRKWFEGIARGDYPHIFDRTPLRREQTVEDIGNAVVFLASANSLNITGQCLMVDGGMVKL
ncbi:MAG: SDR family NAD(P)-dependent oxidoreductase [Proteobacteria bacterium]|nr:SDR family NAD(P)-dependent oxidoreductase [Pseudomonadota bacterium]